MNAQVLILPLKREQSLSMTLGSSRVYPRSSKASTMSSVETMTSMFLMLIPRWASNTPLNLVDLFNLYQSLGEQQDTIETK